MTGEEDQTQLAKGEESSEDQASEVLAELEEDLPDNPPTLVRQMMAMFGVGPAGRAFHPVFDKFEPEHVEKFLDNSHAEDMERLRIQSMGRWFILAYAVLAIAFFGWLIWSLLPNDKQLLSDILTLGVVFAGGLGSGYGLKTYQESRRRGGQ